MGDELVGEKFSGYCLIEAIGEGGMGVVYLAEQLERVERIVALKVIKRGMDTDELIARFALERQTLASLEHPHIARVLDAGVTPDGRPFFAMELVEGVPITLFCEREKLDRAARIRLFLQACEAVAHAHRHGVIHRDLKPGNLMVSGCAPGDLKVIDFGIAKVTRAHSDPGRTLAGQVVGTPEYMSPEQAAGVDVDTRADIFALGSVLAELLPKTERARELNWIVLRATEEDRERRYESVTDLAEDLERFLEDRPVTARRPSSLYQLRKFVQRNRAAVVAGILIVAACAFGVGKMIEAESLRFEADMAALEHEKASMFTTFFSEWFDAMREPEGEARDRSMLEAVRYFDENLARTESARPEVAFLTKQTLGRAYLSLGDLESAEAALLDARHQATLFEIRYDEMPLLAGVETSLGEIFIEQDRLDEATHVAERLIGDHRYEPTPELVNFLAEVGQCLCESNRHKKAEELFGVVVEYETAMNGAGSDQWLHSVAWTAHTAAQLGRREESIDILEEALRQASGRVDFEESEEVFGIREDIKRLKREDG